MKLRSGANSEQSIVGATLRPRESNPKQGSQGGSNSIELSSLCGAPVSSSRPVHPLDAAFAATDKKAGILGVLIAAVGAPLVNLAKDLLEGNPPVAGYAQPMRVIYHAHYGAIWNCPSMFYDEAFYKGVHGDFDSNHFHDVGAREGRVSTPWLNLGYYMAVYTDIGPAHPVEHVALAGIPEGRKLSPFYDPHYYWNRYPDLQAAFGHLSGQDRYRELLKHFINYGLEEGRTASEECSAHSYLQRYPDLANAGYTHKRAIFHYYKHGIGEGRDASTFT